jgi:hypothetical protein
VGVCLLQQTRRPRLDDDLKVRHLYVLARCHPKLGQGAMVVGQGEAGPLGYKRAHFNCNLILTLTFKKGGRQLEKICLNFLNLRCYTNRVELKRCRLKYPCFGPERLRVWRAEEHAPRVGKSVLYRVLVGQEINEMRVPFEGNIGVQERD